MKNLFIFFLSILFLVGCSQVAQQDNNIDTNNTTGGLISRVPISTTGSFEIFSESSYFDIFKNKPGCNLTSGENNTTMIYCNGISGYDYLYKIPSLKLEYLYQPSRFGYSDEAIGQFLNITGSGYPMIISGNAMYSVKSGSTNPLLSSVIMMPIIVNEDPETTIKKLIDDRCDYIKQPIDRLLTGNYIGYRVEVYHDNGNSGITFDDQCIKGVYNNGSDSSWNFIFSQDPKDYYYIIGSIAGGNQVYSYDNSTLKLFVE